MWLFLKKQFEIQKYRRLWKLVIQHKMLLLLYFVLQGLDWKDNWFWISKEMWLFLNFKSSLGKKWEKELVTVKTELVRDIYKLKLFNKVISKHIKFTSCTKICKCYRGYRQDVALLQPVGVTGVTGNRLQGL